MFIFSNGWKVLIFQDRHDQHDDDFESRNMLKYRARGRENF